MDLRWWSEFPEDRQLRKQWNALVLQAESPEVFFTWEWAAAVARSLGTTLKPWIATAHQAGELIGVASLAKTSQRQIVFLAGSTADYCDFISPSETRHEFVHRVLGDLREQGARSIVLANLPAHSITVAALKANHRFHCFVRDGYRCPQVRLGSDQERQGLLASFGKKKMLRRSLSMLEWVGHVSLRCDSAAGFDQKGLDAFFVMHVARFLRTGRISNVVMPERRKFLEELARLLGESGWFELSGLYVGQQVIAYNYGFNFEGSRFWYQPTLHNDWEGFSPGFCLLAKILEDSCRNPKMRLVDLGLGAEGYKERFANSERTTLHVTVSRHRSADWRARGRHWAATTITNHPKLESATRRAQSAAGRFLQRVRKDGPISALISAGSRLRRSLVSKEEVFFFHWSPSCRLEQEPELVALDWKILALTALRFPQDKETLTYLQRASDRLQSRTCTGYAVLGNDGTAEHLAWAAPYEGFAMAELATVLKAPSASAVMIFDCWTPHELRGQGLYSQAIQQLAQRLSAQGADVWIFGAADNSASVAGIEKAAFHRQFSMVKWKVFSWSKIREIRRCTIDDQPAQAVLQEVKSKQEIA